MNAEAIKSLIAYHYWAHDRVWECVMALTDAQFVEDVTYSIGSVRNHFVHLINVDERWIARVHGDAELPGRREFADYPTRGAVRSEWVRVEQRVRHVVTELDDAAVGRVIEYDMAHRGGMKHDAVWQILAHMVNHGTDHRAQVLAVLYSLGAPTVEQDLMFYAWEQYT